ncbi:23S rRNA (cytidine(2498)-2'-O)-methyltransferase RlmM [Uliginosibacterium sp. H3]|uniref:Ribosomal RNA large subunit methyltransferase M n=1 Tax=Uliginosibacterium silvisoli TaxID=3114758 RepID=A0ABU6JXS9_9RHOO|nr:23S rRNA (cytidine(2498)-2'-O)-methyltransferase RlmM [Uliginosibacterium sp. H3]
MSLLATGLVMHCRAGFESEVAAEVIALCGRHGISGVVRTKPDTALVRFTLDQPHDWQALLAALPFSEWIFARERFAWLGSIKDLPEQDRAGFITQHLVALYAKTPLRFGRVSCEFADTNEAKEVSGFVRKFAPHLEKALGKKGMLAMKADAPTLHLFFETSGACDFGVSMPEDASPWPMGIAHLRMPIGAPSRSTLKMAEAFFALMSEKERASTLRAGLKAVDLGAAPGGWTLQFAQRGVKVSAIDNGPIAESVLATGLVEHIRADGFVWRPKQRVDWMVCDMVEQPARVAELIADWFVTGRCRRSIFNLKLPMKKRYVEVEKCRALISARLDDEGLSHVMRARHLYHDREEITAYLALI